jgi:hypothetical protein
MLLSHALRVRHLVVLLILILWIYNTNNNPYDDHRHFHRPPDDIMYYVGMYSIRDYKECSLYIECIKIYCNNYPTVWRNESIESYDHLNRRKSSLDLNKNKQSNAIQVRSSVF